MQLPEITPQIDLKTKGLATFFRENLIKKEDSENSINDFIELIERELANQEDSQKLQILSKCWTYTPLSNPEFEQYMQTIELEIATKILEKLFLSEEKIPNHTEIDQKLLSFIQNGANAIIIWEKFNKYRNLHKIQKSTQEDLASLN